MIACDIDNLGKSAARFDFAKLADLNGHYIRQTPAPEILAQLKHALPEMEGGTEIEKAMRAPAGTASRSCCPVLKDRAKTLKELADASDLLTAQRPLKLDDKAAGARRQRQIVAEVAGRRHRGRIRMAGSALTEAAVRTHAESTGTKLGNLAAPLRAALTGRTVSPPLFDIMAALGRDKTLARIGDQAA